MRVKKDLTLYDQLSVYRQGKVSYAVFRLHRRSPWYKKVFTWFKYRATLRGILVLISDSKKVKRLPSAMRRAGLYRKTPGEIDPSETKNVEDRLHSIAAWMCANNQGITPERFLRETTEKQLAAWYVHTSLRIVQEKIARLSAAHPGKKYASELQDELRKIKLRLQAISSGDVNKQVFANSTGRLKEVPAYYKIRHAGVLK